jgi:hypothetical protein
LTNAEISIHHLTQLYMHNGTVPQHIPWPIDFARDYAFRSGKRGRLQVGEPMIEVPFL